MTGRGSVSRGQIHRTVRAVADDGSIGFPGRSTGNAERVGTGPGRITNERDIGRIDGKDDRSGIKLDEIGAADGIEVFDQCFERCVGWDDEAKSRIGHAEREQPGGIGCERVGNYQRSIHHIESVF